MLIIYPNFETEFYLNAYELTLYSAYEKAVLSLFITNMSSLFEFLNNYFYFSWGLVTLFLEPKYAWSKLELINFVNDA